MYCQDGAVKKVLPKKCRQEVTIKRVPLRVCCQKAEPSIECHLKNYVKGVPVKNMPPKNYRHGVAVKKLPFSGLRLKIAVKEMPSRK